MNIYQTHLIKWKPLIISIFLALGVGGLSGFLTKGSMDIYQTLMLPPLSPPAIVFPIVWTILYILMGISAYLIYISNSDSKKCALAIYALQLAFNFAWSLIFFNSENYLFALIWLTLLWVLIIATILFFYQIDKTAAYLLIAYLLWVTFAAYLNFGVYLLNK